MCGQMVRARDGGAVISRSSRRADPRVLGAVALGGALGTGARYELVQAFPVPDNGFPWTTFIINVAGAYVLGVLLTFVLERWPPTRYARPFLAIGVLGAFTTWSALAVETDLLVKDGHAATAVAYIVASIVAGLAGAYLGIVTGRAWPIMRRSTR